MVTRTSRSCRRSCVGLRAVEMLEAVIKSNYAYLAHTHPGKAGRLLANTIRNGEQRSAIRSAAKRSDPVDGGARIGDRDAKVNVSSGMAQHPCCGFLALNYGGLLRWDVSLRLVGGPGCSNSYRPRNPE